MKDVLDKTENLISDHKYLSDLVIKELARYDPKRAAHYQDMLNRLSCETKKLMG